MSPLVARAGCAGAVPADGGASYAAFAARVTSDGVIVDPWLDGCPRLSADPIVLSRAQHRRLAACAEAVAAVHDEIVRIVLREPALLDDFFAMTPVQQAMFASQAPAWHGVARADLFLTDRGPVCCELNCDTPSGQAEAIALPVLARRAGTRGRDPSRRLEAALSALVESQGRRVRRAAPGPLAVGILYPTEMTEDHSMVALYRRWLEARGHRVVLGSPFNLEPARDGGVGLFGERCDVFVRHYKTDWWGERRPVWDDETPYPDAAPLDRPLAVLLGAVLGGHAAVVNPFGAVLPQNKRCFAFAWEESRRFSPAARAAIRAFLPESIRLERADLAALRREREAWVLKSDYGCEGDEVIVGREVGRRVWNESLARALPGRWIAQRAFRPRRDRHGRAANLGVYLVAGRASGMYARLSPGATDVTALSAPVLVRDRGAAS